MALRPIDFLDDARTVLASVGDAPETPAREVGCRHAVVSAYYALYHEALGKARSRGYRPEDSPFALGSHESLWRWWDMEGAEGSRLASIGATVKRDRVDASYRLGTFFPPRRAAAVIDLIAEGFELLSA